VRLRRAHHLPQPAPAGAIRHWCYPRPAKACQYPLGACASGALTTCPSPRQRELSGTGATGFLTQQPV